MYCMLITWLWFYIARTIHKVTVLLLQFNVHRAQPDVLCSGTKFVPIKAADWKPQKQITASLVESLVPSHKQTSQIKNKAGFVHNIWSTGPGVYLSVVCGFCGNSETQVSLKLHITFLGSKTPVVSILTMLFSQPYMFFTSMLLFTKPQQRQIVLIKYLNSHLLYSLPSILFPQFSMGLATMKLTYIDRTGYTYW